MTIRYEKTKFGKRGEKRVGHVVIATSVNEICEAAVAATKSHPKPYDKPMSERPDMGREFENLEEAAAAATQPWDDGIKLVSEMMIELRKEIKMPKPVSLKRQKVWSDEDGDEIDFDRLRAGEPFYRTTKKQNAIKTKQVTLFVDIGAAAHVNSKDILWRGIAVIALSKILEDAGYRVELWTMEAAMGAFESGKGLATLTRLKGMKDRLNIGTIASCVSAWYFRSVGFNLYNLFQKENHDYGLGYPLHKNLEPIMDLVEPDAEKRLVVKDIWSREECGKFVKDVINRLNSEADAKLVGA